MRDLVAKAVEQFFLSLFGSHAGNALKTHVDLLHGAFQIAFATLDLALHGRELVLARIEAFDATIEAFLALIDAVFGIAHLAHTLFVFGLGLLLHLEDLVFGLHHGLASQRFSLALGRSDELLGLFGGLLARSVDEVAGDDETGGDACDGDDDNGDKPDVFGHRFPLSCIRIQTKAMYRCTGNKKNAGHKHLA